MMLRASVEQSGQSFDLEAVGGISKVPGTVPHQEALLAFAEAVTLCEEHKLDFLRSKLMEALGTDGFIDACAVVAAFHGFTRVADCAGVPVDDRYVEDAPEVQAATGVKIYKPR